MGARGGETHGDGGSIGVRIDITDLKRREASFHLLFEENPLPMWVADAKTRQLMAVNGAMCRHYGYAREALLAISEPQLEHSETDDSTERDFELHKTACGDGIQVVIESRPLIYDGRPAFVSVAFDVTERNRTQQKISYLACHDALTDLPNRTALDQHLVAALQRAEVSDGGLAVLCIDLDHFKEINDLFGHAIGDAVLREASRRLQEAAQGSYVARVGETSSSVSPINYLAGQCGIACHQDASGLRSADRGRRSRLEGGSVRRRSHLPERRR